MSAKDDHLSELKSLTHDAAKKDRLGCIGRHETDYKSKKWPDCNYRKNAEQYSIGNETHVYNIPSFRTPESWIRFTMRWLSPVLFAQSNKTRAGKVKFAMPLAPVAAFRKTVRPGDDKDDPKLHCWDLSHRISDTSYNKKGITNYQGDNMPYWNQVHHIISCDEIYRAFDFDELRLLVLAEYNINRSPNAIILPQQECVAYTLQIPAHCPDKGNHEDYSTDLREKLSDLKNDFKTNEDGNQHPIDDKNVKDLVKQLEKYSEQLRKFLIEIGNKTPGVKLDNLEIPSFV
jgi:hypothetical protein